MQPDFVAHLRLVWSPSKASITYERGSPKTSSWRERMEKLNSEASLQDAEVVLQETFARLKETEQMEERAAKSPQEEEKTDVIMEPSPQPSLGSYYNFLDVGKIIPQKFTVPLFLALEEERVRTHTWMRIAKYRGVADIGPLEDKETQRELARVRHVESSQQAKLREENELLRQ